MASKTNAEHAVDALARGLEHLVQVADYFSEGLPRTRDGRALTRDLRDLRGRAYAALLRLQEIDPCTVRDVLTEVESHLLCLCPE